ncbi:MAG: rod shape-determining protein MreC, partial [Sulfuricaulis sp.]|nr:rod shape-determining protein MreC [Sulfuricaulis sp.]
NRNGLLAIAFGTGEPDTVSIRYLTASADIKQGDLLVSSGIGGGFPFGYPVAKVKKIVNDPNELFLDIIATPVAQLSHNKEVLLIWPAKSAMPAATKKPVDTKKPTAANKTSFTDGGSVKREAVSESGLIHRTNAGTGVPLAPKKPVEQKKPVETPKPVEMTPPVEMPSPAITEPAKPAEGAVP